jgi:hypothetical protein
MYFTIKIIKTKEIKFKKGETLKINKCNYKLTFSKCIKSPHSLVTVIWLTANSDNRRYTVYIHILWQVDPLLGNGRKTSN